MEEPPEVPSEPRIAGLVKVSVSPNRSATGLLRIMGQAVPFKLEFDQLGHGSVTVRLGAGTAILTLDLLNTSNGPRINGAIAVASNMLEFQGVRAAASAARGRYLFYVSPSNPSPSVPAFVGSGAIDISERGSARVVAHLLLGGGVTQGTVLLEDGSILLDLVPSSRTAILGGNVSLTFGEGLYLYASLPYFLAPKPARAQYPGGVDIRVDLLATQHRVQRPPLPPSGPGNPLLIMLSGGDLESSLSFKARMLPTGLILPPATWRYSIGYADPNTGLVRGAFAHPDTGRPKVFHGVIDSASSEIQAGFLDETEAGRVRIVPESFEG